MRFLLELSVLGALGYWGFQTGKGLLLKLLLGLGAPLLVAVLWGSFGSPKAAVPLTGPLRLLLEVAVFGSGAVALYFAGRPSQALLFGLIMASNRALMYLWDQ